MKWKQVSKAELEAFVAGYPHALDVNVTGICEPPMRSWNDFSEGKVWPESMVAREFLEESMSGHPAYTGGKNTFWLRANEKGQR